MRSGLLALAVGILVGCQGQGDDGSARIRAAYEKMGPQIGKLSNRSPEADLELLRSDLAKTRDSLGSAVPANESDRLKKDLIKQELARIEAAQRYVSQMKEAERIGRTVLKRPDVTFSELTTEPNLSGTSPTLALLIEEVRATSRTYEVANNKMQELLRQVTESNAPPAPGDGRDNR